MTIALKLSLSLLFVLFFQNSFSQKDKAKILANFDYIEYYPDSTIRSAGKRQFTLDWLTVEFNEAGVPVAIGNIQNVEKVGQWIYSDGSRRYFAQLRGAVETTVVFDPYNPADNRTESLRPRYEADVLKDKEEFQKKYESLLNSTIKR